MAKAKAKAEKLVERVVVGPKGIWVNTDDGSKRLAGIGETVKIPAKSAKAFARYLEAPGVAKAKAAAKAAEDEAAADEGDENDEAEETSGDDKVDGAGDDSEES